MGIFSPLNRLESLLFLLRFEVETFFERSKLVPIDDLFLFSLLLSSIFSLTSLPLEKSFEK